MKNYNRRQGEKYGDWIVVDLDETRLKEKMSGVHLYYIVKCSICDKHRVVAQNDLIKLDKCRDCNKINLIGKTFGKIKIISDAGYDDRYNRKRRIWLGKCECGIEKTFFQECLMRGDTTACGKCRPKGPQHPRYNPYSDRYNKRDSTEYRQFAKEVFKRDKYCCVICGSTKKLNAHHLNGWHWHFQGRFDPNNAVTLCGHANGCHTLFHKMFGNKFNTKLQYEQFALHRKLILKKK
jgi:hypothetical protein